MSYFFVSQSLLLFLLLLSSSPLLTKQSPHNSRIVGGEIVTSPDQFPWIVRLVYFCPGSPTFKTCTGSLLNNNTILTAAHCVDETCVEDQIRIVETGISTSNFLEVRRNVIYFERHPDYEDTTYPFGDIAIWQVDKPFTKVKEFATPATSDLYTGSIVTAAGWGIIEGGEQATQLSAVNVSILDSSVCQELSEALREIAFTRDFVDEKEICSGGGGKGICQGDSGGPLFDRKERIVYGIPSYGTDIVEDCGKFQGLFLLCFSFVFFSFFLYFFYFNRWLH